MLNRLLFQAAAIPQFLTPPIFQASWATTIFRLARAPQSAAGLEWRVSGKVLLWWHASFARQWMLFYFFYFENIMLLAILISVDFRFCLLQLHFSVLLVLLACPSSPPLPLDWRGGGGFSMPPFIFA